MLGHSQRTRDLKSTKWHNTLTKDTLIKDTNLLIFTSNTVI